MLKLLVNAMLRSAYSADELHDGVEAAVEWIEAHPNATEYGEE